MKRVILALLCFLTLLTGNCSKKPTAPVISGWEVLSIGTNIDLLKVSFVDVNNGWVIGREDSVVFHTTDGGDTWNRQVVPPVPGICGPYLPWGDVFFVDSANGWAVTTCARIYKTTDGGANWVIAETSLGFGSLGEIFFTDLTHGWVDGSASVGDWRTTDGGESWEKIQTGWDDFVDSLNGWSGFEGSIYRSYDGGLTWQSISSPGGFVGISLDFVDLSHGWGLVGQRVSEYDIWYWLIHTFDGGYTWEPQLDTFKYKLGNGVGPMEMISENTGWIAKLYGKNYENIKVSILHTTNGGNKWLKQQLPNEIANKFISDIDFIDELHGWAVGSAGLLLRTGNGGEPLKQL
ncbi:MAG: hypothetical protein A2142_00810 [candidate division Zixibacteria bacterium RBG_16_48_11]|nr:MAG: hypothetical protein A2142_00810 [candidate division Zixibacteria bacterium RBG_16_48_11]